MFIKIIESIFIIISLTTYMIPMDPEPVKRMNQNLPWIDKKEAYTLIFQKMLSIRHNLSCVIDMELNNVMLDYMPDNIPDDERPYFNIINPLCYTSPKRRRMIDSTKEITSTIKNESVTMPTCEKYLDMCLHQQYHDYRKVMDWRTTNLELSMMY
ncbi:uncharacterized protein LOC143217912 [Lasioglossum baleicum]|uniref:uncharacterized protein LOC143217912 n=1 Tax=Lasioglossum baleicum TaxID=434251 RepID=UPI003FCE6E58